MIRATRSLTNYRRARDIVLKSSGTFADIVKSPGDSRRLTPSEGFRKLRRPPTDGGEMV
jgi:hypothetical protein